MFTTSMSSRFSRITEADSPSFLLYCMHSGGICNMLKSKDPYSVFNFMIFLDKSFTNDSIDVVIINIRKRFLCTTFTVMFVAVSNL